jgi:hypothetical protein
VNEGRLASGSQHCKSGSDQLPGNPLAMTLKVFSSSLPSRVALAMITMKISEAISAYSIEVAPD